MMSTSDKNTYIDKHKNAFEVENSYILNIFESFVDKIERITYSILECSCKIEYERLYPARFNIGFAPNNEKQFNAVFKFLSQIAVKLDVELDYSLFKRLLSSDFNLVKIKELIVGVDLRRELSESRLKIGLTIEDYPELTNFGINLHSNLKETAQTLLTISYLLHIGLDLYLDGHSEIEIYPYIKKDEFQEIGVRQKLERVLSNPALNPLPVCSRICVGLSNSNSDKIIYYYLERLDDFHNYFLVNDTARAVHAYYREHLIREMCVALPEQELVNGITIQKLNLYYLMT